MTDSAAKASPSSDAHASRDGHASSDASTAVITPERIAGFDEASIAELAHRLDEDDYPTPFAGLQDWHLMRALAIHRPELARPYLHLVDQEPFDED